MSKGKVTRDYIITKSAPIFNEKGYSGLSMADIMDATGLKKGGIYNHFTSKDEIALSAFDHNWGLLQSYYEQAIQQAGDSPTVQLRAAISAHADIANDAALAGGCPLLNTAIESDDGHPQLRERVRAAMNLWQTILQDIVAHGISVGEFKATAESCEVAAIIISTLEGGIMLTKLYQDPQYIHTATSHLQNYITAELLI